MPLRLNLQWKVLLLVAITITAILLASSYLHGLITQSLSEETRYNNAIRQVVTVARRTQTYNYFNSPADLLQEIEFLANARPEFLQLDVYQDAPGGEKLVTTTAPNAPRLPYLNEQSKDNEFREMERPLPDVTTMEVERDGQRRWLITASITQGRDHGYVSALVQKNSPTNFITRLQFQQNLVLAGASVVSIALLYLLFVIFFRRPAQDIASAMAQAGTGNLSARATVRRDDELGTIAKGFNRMIDEIRSRDEEREKLLSQVSGFNDELQLEVERATTELRASNEALFEAQQRLSRSERLAAVGQIAASLAHEIGTPLNAISGHLALLARKHPHDQDTRRRVEIINSQIDSVVKSIRSLLARTQRPRPELQPLDLNALIRELLWLVQPTLDAHDISVTVNLDNDLPLIPGDRDSLLQLFLNLTNNSIDAMPKGGELEITTRFDRISRSAELLFCDSGVGIEPSAAEHLFELMWTTKEAGSGFGLAIAHEIAIEHGGKIEMVVERRQGAAFRLSLPLPVAAVSGLEVVTDAA
ncbi:MAG: two-component system, NtrC family, sensor kinase [Blastocatellia bacterium]|jgi:signal transduction histidine kinase|nr:two-component system, NtrC family, sensor kinase [Blastocatellia bacterium]